MNSDRLARQLDRLFLAQNGLCHWCKKPMMRMHGHRPHVTEPLNRATLDHLDDRFSPMRGKFKGELRHVAACYGCNNRRGNERQAARPIEDLRERARRAPRAEQESR